MTKLPTQKKIDIMQAYMEGKNISWWESTSGVFTGEFGIHNIKNEEPGCSPIWNWGSVDYEIKAEPVKVQKWVNLMKDGSIAGYYFSAEEAEDCSGEWNSRVAVPVVIMEIN